MPLRLLAAALITLFWGAMWAILIRTELRPAGAALRAVPVEHVLRTLFQHQQTSDLFIAAEGRRLGRLQLTPSFRPEDGRRLIDLSGNVRLALGPGAGERLSWEGTLELDAAMALQTLRLHFTTGRPGEKGPPTTEADLTLDAATRQAAGVWKSRGETVLAQSFTLDEAGARALLEQLGVDPTLLGTLRATAAATPPTLSAQQSSLEFRGERVETWLVTVAHNGQTLLELHLSQLGQVLRAKTLVGWTLEPE